LVVSKSPHDADLTNIGILYRQEVFPRTRNAEHYRYAKSSDLAEMKVTSKPNGKIEVEIKDPL
jgi:hypothetical protein